MYKKLKVTFTFSSDSPAEARLIEFKENNERGLVNEHCSLKAQDFLKLLLVNAFSEYERDKIPLADRATSRPPMPTMPDINLGSPSGH